MNHNIRAVYHIPLQPHRVYGSVTPYKGHVALKEKDMVYGPSVLGVLSFRVGLKPCHYGSTI